METRGFNTKPSVLHKYSNNGKYGNLDMLRKRESTKVFKLPEYLSRREEIAVSPPPVSGDAAKSPCLRRIGTV